MKQGKIIPKDKTLLVPDSKTESPEAAPLDRQALIKLKVREYNDLK